MGDTNLYQKTFYNGITRISKNDLKLLDGSVSRKFNCQLLVYIIFAANIKLQNIFLVSVVVLGIFVGKPMTDLSLKPFKGTSNTRFIY